MSFENQVKNFQNVPENKKKEETKKLLASFHQRLTQMGGLDFSAISPEINARLEKEFGQKVDVKKIQDMAKLAKKLNTDDFVASLTGEHPAVKLSNSELALMNGGWSWYSAASSAMLIASLVTSVGEAGAGAACGLVVAFEPGLAGGGSGTGGTKPVTKK